MPRLLVVLLALVVVPAVRAQEPFERVAVEAGGAAQLTEAFGGRWDAPRGAAASLAAPFYAGRVRMGALIMPYRSTVEGLTDFRGRHVFVEWTMPAEPMPRLTLWAGGRLGVFQMRFDQGTGQQKNEQEVAAALTTGLSYGGTRWAVHARLSYGTVRLSEAERQLFVGLGLSRSFATPAWLGEVLR